MRYDLFGDVIIPENIQNFRVPYMGSKNKIAIDLLREMLKVKPRAKYFYDLCAGGGSMSFTASQIGLKTHYNELQTSLVNFIDYIFDRIKKGLKGQYGLFPDDFYNFIDREEFMKLKEEDSIKGQFARICYSFGNNQKAYLFHKEIESNKRLGHDYIYFNKSIKGVPNCTDNDFYKRRLFLCNFANQEFKKIIKDKPELKKQYKEYLKILKRSYSRETALIFTRWLRSTGIKAKEVNDLLGSEMAGHYLTLNSQPAIPTKEAWEKLKQNPKLIDIPNHIEDLFDLKKRKKLEMVEQLENLERLQNLQQLENLQRLQNLERLENLNNFFTTSNLSYKDVKINTPVEESIIYIDPPYRNTAKYIKGKDFDYKELDEWFKNNKYSCFMSEYNAPHEVIFEIDKFSLLNNSKEKKKVVKEKLFWNDK